MTSWRDIAQLIDHSLLHPTMTDDDIRKGCAVARQAGVKAVCVKPYAIPLAKECLKGSSVLICAVVGFPHGNSMTSVKLRETQEALHAGAAEIDMVVNIGKVLGGQYDYVRDEIRALARLCHRTSGTLKVIFENDFLQDGHIIELCRICSDSEVDFVKTSTGYGFVKQPDGTYNYRGATEAQVRLMRAHCTQHIRIKAAGGIRTLDDLLKFKDLGCTRIGATATESIMEEAQARGIS
ncbi:MAG: deoxyribose-phosphate aldolase [Candidatus Omnitrophica bacterium]|nr:deoxyribose-phosphate aldolase [Candidatus Omnitrophota bacterium]